MKRRATKALVEELLIPLLPDFIEVRGVALRWPIEDSMVHYAKPSFDADGLGFTLYAVARPLVAPIESDSGLLKELGHWRPSPDDPSRLPPSLIAAAHEAQTFFELHGTVARSVETMRLQLYGTWEEAYALGLRHEPQPSAGFLETYGLALRDIDAHEEAEAALTRALEDVDVRLGMPSHNVHSRAGLERRASRITNVLAEYRAGASESTTEPSVINPSQLIP